MTTEAPISEIDDAVAECQNAMAKASRILLHGAALRADAVIVRHPNSYEDDRGKAFFDMVIDRFK